MLTRTWSGHELDNIKLFFFPSVASVLTIGGRCKDIFYQTKSHEDDITAADVTQCETEGSRLGQVTSGSGFQSPSSSTHTMWGNFIRNVASFIQPHCHK